MLIYFHVFQVVIEFLFFYILYLQTSPLQQEFAPESSIFEMMTSSQLRSQVIEIHFEARRWSHVLAAFQAMIDDQVPVDSFTFASAAHAYAVSSFFFYKITSCTIFI